MIIIYHGLSHPGIFNNIDIILESGYGYDTAPDAGNLPIAGGNRVGSRVYSTVSLGAKLSF